MTTGIAPPFHTERARRRCCTCHVQSDRSVEAQLEQRVDERTLFTIDWGLQ